MEGKLQNGDLLIIGGSPYMVIDGNSLLNLQTFTTDFLMEESDLKIGDIVSDEGNPDLSLKVEAIIPKDKISISFKIFG